MSQSKADFLAKLEAIKNEYATDALPSQLADTVAATNAILALEEGQDVSAELLKTLHATAHKLTGSSGTFGFPDISAISREITAFSNASGPIGSTLQASDQEQLREMLERLKNSPEIPSR